MCPQWIVIREKIPSLMSFWGLRLGNPKNLNVGFNRDSREVEILRFAQVTSLIQVLLTAAAPSSQ
jgi:hypothetical protein